MKIGNVLGYCSAAAGIVVSSFLPRGYAQIPQTRINQPFLGNVGAKAYCSAEFRDLNGKPFQGMVEADQMYDDTVIFRIKDRFEGSYKFPSIKDEFPYVGGVKFTFGVNGPIFGDGAGDYVIVGEGEPIFGSADPKRSKLTPEHKRLEDDAAACIKK